MSILSNITIPTDIAASTDSVGGNGPLESGIYNFVIDNAYIDSSAGGAISVNFSFKDQSGREMRSTQYITSGNTKGCLPYYIDKRSGEKRALPGYEIANDISLIAIGEVINEVETETKTLSLYDYVAKKDVPKQKEVIMDLLGKEVTLGVLKVIEDKNVKNDQGAYVPSGEVRTINEIDKVFRTSDSMTVNEIRAEAKNAEFLEIWATKNTNVTRNKTKGVANTGASVGAPAAAANTSATKKLFG